MVAKHSITLDFTSSLSLFNLLQAMNMTKLIKFASLNNNQSKFYRNNDEKI